MKKYIVAGNWKMNTNHQEALELFTEVKNIARDELQNGIELIVFPPFTSLFSLKQLNDSDVKIGAQNICWEEKGAYTGEISAAMVASVGATHVLIGHSERRHYFNETTQMLSSKVNIALKHGLVPVFCIGETLTEREQSSHISVIRAQLTDALFHLNSVDFSKIIIAYEPVWAIGTGLTASPEQAQEIHAEIRKAIAEKFDDKVASEITILYGGSCSPKNAAELFSQSDIDGGLIGGAALKSRDFIDIARFLQTAKK